MLPPETKTASPTPPPELNGDAQFYKFKAITDFCLQSFEEKHQQQSKDASTSSTRIFQTPHEHRVQLWRVQNEILEHSHKDVGGKLTRMMGVMFYEVTILLPSMAVVYQAPEDLMEDGVPSPERVFVRFRRWSSFDALRKKVGPILAKYGFNHPVGSDYPGGPYLCPAKSRLFANKSTVAGKFSLCLNLFFFWSGFTNSFYFLFFSLCFFFIFIFIFYVSNAPRRRSCSKKVVRLWQVAPVSSGPRV